MAHYTAEVIWARGEQAFVDNRYSRGHLLRFDGGVEMPGSASPHLVRAPMSDVAAVDPEEMLVASLASCHMLFFLGFAAKQGFRVDHYADAATGVMGKNDEGRMAMTLVTLHPAVTFSGEQLPTHEAIEQLHREAHEACFIANSIRAEVRCEPSP
jgi:organic hydroperoxide reductase OsmC/OhrA